MELTYTNCLEWGLVDHIKVRHYYNCLQHFFIQNLHRLTLWLTDDRTGSGFHLLLALPGSVTPGKQPNLWGLGFLFRKRGSSDRPPRAALRIK